MPTAATSILRAATRQYNTSLNVLSFATHERYQQVFGLTPHEYYLYRGPGLKEWDFRFASLPNNTTLLPYQQIFPDLDFDVILCQSRYGQFKMAKEFSKAWQVPLICLEHTLPHPSWDILYKLKMTQQRGHINVFLSDYSIKEWEWQGDYEIIAPGIDDELFMPDWVLPTQPVILSVVNDWINRDYAYGFNLWKEITKDLSVFVLGDTPGLSKPAKNMDELIGVYRQSRIFLNTSLVSTCPFTLLEAMACGCAVVSTANSMIPQVIQNGVNGYISNDPTILRKRCEELLADETLCKKLGREARRTIEEKFSFKRMAGDWDRLLRRASEIVVIGE